MAQVERLYAAHKEAGSGQEIGLPSQSSQETAESADSSFKKYLQEHGFPKLRELHISMYFGGHKSISDAKELVPHLKNTDVFIPELVNHLPEDEDLLRAIADGSAPSSDVERIQNATHDKGYRKTLVDAIHGSSLKIAIADLPRADAGTVLDTLDNLTNFIIEEIPSRHWSRVAARQLHTRKIEKFINATVVEREKKIVSGICPAIVRAFADDESRSTRESLRVLMSMGYKHAPMFASVSAMNRSTVQILQARSDVLSYKDEIEALYMAHLPISEQLSDAALTETLITGLLTSNVKKMADMDSGLHAMIREAVDEMKDSERERFHNYFMNGDIPGAFKFFQTIAERLASAERKKDEAEE